MALEDEIIGLLVQVANFVAIILDKLVGYLTDLVNKIAIALQAMVQTILNALLPLFTKIADFLQGILTQFATYFQAILDKVTQAFLATWDKIVEVSVIVFDKITTFVENAWSTLKAFAEGLIAEVGGFIDAAVKGITDLVQGAINNVVTTFETAKVAIQNGLAAFLAIAEATFGGVVSRIEGAYQQLLTGAEAIIVSVERRLSDLRGAFKDAADQLVKQLAGVAEEDLGPIRDAIKAFVKEFTILSDPADQSSAIQAMRRITSGEFTMEQFREFVQGGWEHLVPKSPLWQALFIGLLFILNTIPVIVHLSEASSRIVTQQFDYNFPTEILESADAIRAWRKGLLPAEIAVDAIRKHGITSEESDLLLSLSAESPGVSDLLVMRQRGIISQDDLARALFSKGHDDHWTQALVQASQRIPSPSDLITIAGSGAFDEQTSERLGLSAEYPEILTEHAARTGLTENWIRTFWSSHWSSPGPGALTEMHHRGIIADDDLSLGMRISGVPVFWRDRLLKASYLQLSRIDIRRMHRLGIITTADVLAGYKALGYSPQNAQLLTDFTVKLNKPPTPDDTATVAELSRSNILGFYDDGILTTKQAATLLVALGYSAETAALFLESADLTRQRTERKAETDLVISQAVAGIMTFSEAQTKLDSLGLETLEKERAILALIRAEQGKTKLPSREEAEKMLAAEIITPSDYRDLLSRLGYAPKWADAFVKLFEAKSKSKGGQA